MLAELCLWLFYIAIRNGEIIKTNHIVIHKKIMWQVRVMKVLEIEVIYADIFLYFPYPVMSISFMCKVFSDSLIPYSSGISL